MQWRTATTRHGVTKKEAQKDYNIQEIYLERTYISHADKSLLQIDMMV